MQKPVVADTTIGFLVLVVSRSVCLQTKDELPNQFHSHGNEKEMGQWFVLWVFIQPHDKSVVGMVSLEKKVKRRLQTDSRFGDLKLEFSQGPFVNHGDDG